jgi:hypothetical protein
MFPVRPPKPWGKRRVEPAGIWAAVPSFNVKAYTKYLE